MLESGVGKIELEAMYVSILTITFPVFCVGVWTHQQRLKENFAYSRRVVLEGFAFVRKANRRGGEKRIIPQRYLSGIIL